MVTLIFFPVVLAYQGWSLYVFRKRLATPPAGGSTRGLQRPEALRPWERSMASWT